MLIKFRNFILRKNVLAWYIIVACKGLNLQKILSGTGKGRITYSRGVASTCRMESFAIIVNGFKPLTIVAKLTILDVGGDPGYVSVQRAWKFS